MQDRNRGYVGMYLSAFYFTLVLFMEYYALYVYYFGNGWLADRAYAMILRSGLPTTGVESRWILCGLLFGGIMMYRPKKKKGLHRQNNGIHPLRHFWKIESRIYEINCIIFV